MIRDVGVRPGFALRLHMAVAVVLVALVYLALLGVLVRLGTSIYVAVGVVAALILAHLWATNSVYRAVLFDGSRPHGRFGSIIETGRYWNRELRPWLVVPVLPLVWWVIWSHDPSEIVPYVRVAIALAIVEVPIFAFVRYRNRGRNRPQSIAARVRVEVPNDSRAAEAGRLLAGLCKRADTSTPVLFVRSVDPPNAWAMGWTPRTGAIGVTGGLLGANLTSDEMETVLAHELGHLLNRDSAILQLASVPAALTRFVFEALAEDPGGPISGLASLILAGAVYPLVLITVLITVPLSRQREYSADRAAALLTGHPLAAIAALQKITGRIEQSSSTDLAPLRPAESLMFAWPSSKGIKHRIGRLFSTHPSLENRVKALRELAADMQATQEEPSLAQS